MLFAYSAAAAALVGVASASLYGESDLNHTCVLEPAYLSCSAQASSLTADTCCAETYGGLYCDLSRQFDPSTSPNTTNGLRNGTVVPPYTGPGVDTFINAFGKYDLLAYMNKYWINQGASNEAFWAHEFSKHATCYSTFDVPCYGPNYVPHQEVIEFYETAIMYYKRNPTYDWLAKAGITPSNSTTYTLSDMQDALTAEFGAVPYIGCSGPKYNTIVEGAGSTDTGRTVIDEVWYYQHVFGRPQDGNSVPVNATSPNTSCAKSAKAISYYLRTPSSLQT